MYKYDDYHRVPNIIGFMAIFYSRWMLVLRSSHFKVSVLHIYGNYCTIQLVSTLISAWYILNKITKNQLIIFISNVVTITKFIHKSSPNPIVFGSCERFSWDIWTILMKIKLWGISILFDYNYSKSGISGINIMIFIMYDVINRYDVISS